MTKSNCKDCMHSKVCSYQDQFSQIVNRLDSQCIAGPYDTVSIITDLNWVSVDVKCNYFVTPGSLSFTPGIKSVDLPVAAKGEIACY